MTAQEFDLILDYLQKFDTKDTVQVVIDQLYNDNIPS